MAAKFEENEEVLEAIRFLVKEVRRVEAKLDAVLEQRQANGHAAPEVASDSDLDGSRGDPEVKRDPKHWNGSPQAPCRMSECPPDYLDVLAGFLQWKADNPREGKEKFADYDRRDAARARGWAARKRAAIAAGDEL